MKYLTILLLTIVCPIVAFQIEQEYNSESYIITILCTLAGIMALVVYTLIRKVSDKRISKINPVDVGIDESIELAIDVAIDSAGDVLNSVDVDL
ncbi:MAG: hypothetical protein OCC49_15050 [Fibrobacterales bacterium]